LQASTGVEVMPIFEPHSLTGRSVRFHVRDVHLPEPGAVLEQLHAGDVLEGVVVNVSDGRPDNVFVVVAVNGLSQPCVLAAGRILSSSPPDASVRMEGGDR
jgi:hypothetical protein